VCKQTFEEYKVFRIFNVQGGSNMTGTDLYVNKPHCAAACLHTNQSRSYLNHLVLQFSSYETLAAV